MLLLFIKNYISPDKCLLNGIYIVRYTFTVKLKINIIKVLNKFD